MLLTGPKLQAQIYAHGSNATGRQSPFPVIHAGDVVQLRRQERNLRIEVAGRAEENGAIGSKVRVRLLHSGFDAGQEQTFIGIVRGPGNVEIEP
jgi:flagella basal body P-ring formation protein FlgA